MAGQPSQEGDSPETLLEEALSRTNDPEVRYHIREALQLGSEN